jgi:hypothetical protein
MGLAAGVQRAPAATSNATPRLNPYTGVQRYLFAAANEKLWMPRTSRGMTIEFDARACDEMPSPWA